MKAYSLCIFLSAPELKSVKDTCKSPGMKCMVGTLRFPQTDRLRFNPYSRINKSKYCFRSDPGCTVCVHPSVEETFLADSQQI